MDGAHSGTLALFCNENVNCDIVTVTKGSVILFWGRGEEAVCDPDSPLYFFFSLLFHYIASYSDFMALNQCPTRCFT